MAKIFIPTALRYYTERQSLVEVPGVSVKEVLLALVEKYPDIEQHVFEADGQLRSFVNIFIGDTNIKQLDGVETAIEADAKLSLIPAIAGGLRQ